jgi:hypothetical protein
MTAQQRMKLANEKASKNITQRGNVVKGTVIKSSYETLNDNDKLVIKVQVVSQRIE